MTYLIKRLSHNRKNTINRMERLFYRRKNMTNSIKRLFLNRKNTINRIKRLFHSRKNMNYHRKRLFHRKPTILAKQQNIKRGCPKHFAHPLPLNFSSPQEETIPLFCINSIFLFGNTNKSSTF